jgi:hypothetical protein
VALMSKSCPEAKFGACCKVSGGSHGRGGVGLHRTFGHVY